MVLEEEGAEEVQELSDLILSFQMEWNERYVEWLGEEKECETLCYTLYTRMVFNFSGSSWE